MKKENQELFKEKHSEIRARFNQVLAEIGLENVTVKHFSITDRSQTSNNAQRKCVKYAEVCSPITGACYLRCIKYKDQA